MPKEVETRNDDDANSKGSGTTFGSSVESQAQVSDASAEAASSVAEGEPLNIYRLEPVAEPDDPRWENSPPSGVVLVAARTTGDARIVAAGRELDFMEVDAAPAEGVTTMNASAFRSDKLYTVIEVDHGRRDQTRGIIQGNVRIDTIRPVQI